MTTAPPDAATRAQIAAADPAGSIWLAANAGSGKTRVLTDRVAWLLLDGTPPERILCLTYTKAAAGEMQNRLFGTLGTWAMLPDDALRAAITRLGAARGTVSSDQLRRARTLFARAIETPGGLKIQTIHAFCASLLRRFPLEAGVTPAFAEMDDTAAARLHADVLDEMAADPKTMPLVDGIARRLSEEPSAFLRAVMGHREDLADRLDDAALRRALGIADTSPDAIRDAAITAEDVDLIEAVRAATAGESAVTMLRLNTALSQALLADGATRFDLLADALLTKEGQPRKSPVTKPVAARIGEAASEDLSALAHRLAAALVRISAFEALAQSQALHAFAPEFIARVEARKSARGWLDFDDQIARARALLSTSDMAQWVLFKLDGGLDHILVDEAQDTSPRQWDVIAALASEFAAGAGARPDVSRTLFVVGDRKQSIYRFQGADPNAFDRMRDLFGARLTDPPLADHALRHSFRSAPAILDFVDAVFAGDSGLGERPEHIAHDPAKPGRIDLWPAIEQPPEEDDPDRHWFDPVDRPAADDAEVVLARRIADAIRRMIDDGTPITTRDGRRSVREGDILILLQRRKSLFHHVIRECKARNLDLGGADRLSLADDLAVRDLIAVLTWVATPDDDLSLATILRSPLGGLDEAALYDLAQPRDGTLWQALREGGAHPRVTAMLTDLLRGADTLRPYELLQRVLVRHDGRRLILARLGPERAEAIDALLGQALAYEQLQVPSLTGFLGWFETTDVDVKRQPGGGSIRVMSVHGAKGLEAPVVILPETQVRRATAPSGLMRLDDGTVTWLPAKANRAAPQTAMAEARQTADAEERDRLLYVALTRAESWLIVAAAGKIGDAPEDSWHARVRAGLETRGAAPLALPEFEETGLRIEAGDWTPLPHTAPAATAAPDAPPWLEALPDPAPRPAGRLTPSDLPGAKTLPGDGDPGDTDAALRRGTAIHALLEHLPRLAPAARPAAIPAILAQYAELRPEDDADDIAREASGVLAAPDLAHLFAPDTLAELPFALPADGPRPAMFGTMDRVLVAPDRITIVDFKSNRAVPDTPNDTPMGLLAQMGAYAHAAQAIWPGRTVACAILWTATPTLMPLPHDLVKAGWDAIDPAAGGA
ncbi:double-strand break repair helicase AddA [uncultured Jannaschia sp.]|uniref:double-strand break repair helicase AddA n=1 Tax=uncultured Jannaschia sp. TaxID=293347 RepID=UPI002625051D|nr:double-strand break repair helicase AddA [uncultured Jannaschia sp.]